MTGRRVSIIAACGIVTTSALLAGCSVDVVDAQETPPTAESSASQTPQTPQTSAASVTTVAPPSRRPVASSASEVTEGDVTGLRAEYAGAATQRLGCAGGSVTISKVGSIVDLTQDCASVTVDTSGVVLLAGRIGTLNVEGVGAQVIARSVDSVDVSGSGNAISWETGQPDVSDTGVANVITRTKE